jgi:hypothetical protein
VPDGQSEKVLHSKHGADHGAIVHERNAFGHFRLNKVAAPAGEQPMLAGYSTQSKYQYGTHLTATVGGMIGLREGPLLFLLSVICTISYNVDSRRICTVSGDVL